MTALSKFVVLLAIFLSASYANAFASLSPVAGNALGLLANLKETHEVK
jgi:hypothetical protein